VLLAAVEFGRTAVKAARLCATASAAHTPDGPPQGYQTSAGGCTQPQMPHSGSRLPAMGHDVTRGGPTRPRYRGCDLCGVVAVDATYRCRPVGSFPSCLVVCAVAAFGPGTGAHLPAPAVQCARGCRHGPVPHQDQREILAVRGIFGFQRVLLPQLRMLLAKRAGNGRWSYWQLTFVDADGHRVELSFTGYRPWPPCPLARRCLWQCPRALCVLKDRGSCRWLI
jgi:hypothetical protein